MKVWWGTEYLQNFKHLLQNTKGFRKSNFTMERLADPTLIKGSKWTSSVMGQIKTVCHLIGCNETNTAHLCDFCAKDTELESSQEETSHLRTFYKTYGLLSCRASSLWNPRKRRADSKGLKRHENYRQIHLILNWLVFTKKDIIKTISKTWMGLRVTQQQHINIHFLILTHCEVQLCRRMSLFIGDIHLNVSKCQGIILTT